MQVFAIVCFLCLFGGVVSRSTPGNCETIRPFFESKNLTVNFGSVTQTEATNTCKGACCNRASEETLRQQARADFHDLIYHHSRSLQGLLATTANALRETVTLLARQSENKTLILFDQVYRSMSQHSRPSIKSLYQTMMEYVSPSNTPDTMQPSLTREMLQERVSEFFTHLFPIAYHHAVDPDQQDFTDKFKKCLYSAMNEIQPFGDIPKDISVSVSKSFEATRVLVQALTLGKTVLDRTNNVFFYGTNPQQDACYEALLRMTYCSKCHGHGSSIRPCSGFCINVMRGCLTAPASELDLAWSGYVETIERLVVAVDGRTDPLGLNVELAIRQLDTRISDAIMHSMVNGPALTERVRQVCGRPETLGPMVAAREEPVTMAGQSSRSAPPSLEQRMPHLRLKAHRPTSPPLPQQLGNFLASIVRSRTFYGNLADTKCTDYPDKHCWNGERIGEYAKTVVDSSLIAQRYNPEFIDQAPRTVSRPYENSNTSALIDQLRHINQVVLSQLASAPESGVLLADQAFEDGSGSGMRPSWRDHDRTSEDDEDLRGHDDDDGSGSGMGPSTTNPGIETNLVDEPELPGGSAATISQSVLLILAMSVLLVYGA